MLEFCISQLPQTGRMIAYSNRKWNLLSTHTCMRDLRLDNYQKLKPIAFVQEPIPDQKLHYYGKDHHPMAGARHRHFLNSYFVRQSEIRKKRESSN